MVPLCVKARWQTWCKMCEVRQIFVLFCPTAHLIIIEDHNLEHIVIFRIWNCILHDYNGISRSLLHMIFWLVERMSRSLLPRIFDLVGCISRSLLPRIFDLVGCISRSLLPRIFDLVGCISRSLLPRIFDLVGCISRSLLPRIFDLVGCISRSLLHIASTRLDVD